MPTALSVFHKHRLPRIRESSGKQIDAGRATLKYISEVQQPLGVVGSLTFAFWRTTKLETGGIYNRDKMKEFFTKWSPRDTEKAAKARNTDWAATDDKAQKRD